MIFPVTFWKGAEGESINLPSRLSYIYGVSSRENESDNGQVYSINPYTGAKELLQKELIPSYRQDNQSVLAYYSANSYVYRLYYYNDIDTESSLRLEKYHVEDPIRQREDILLYGDYNLIGNLLAFAYVDDDEFLLSSNNGLFSISYTGVVTLIDETITNISGFAKYDGAYYASTLESTEIHQIDKQTGVAIPSESPPFVPIIEGFTVTSIDTMSDSHDGFILLAISGYYYVGFTSQYYAFFNTLDGSTTIASETYGITSITTISVNNTSVHVVASGSNPLLKERGLYLSINGDNSSYSFLKQFESATKYNKICLSQADDYNYLYLFGKLDKGWNVINEDTFDNINVFKKINLLSGEVTDIPITFPDNNVRFFIGDGGGNDMYDSGNFLSTDLSEESITYTHLINYPSPIDENNMVSEIRDGTQWFGTGSSYFTNNYGGLFTLLATNADFHKFEISGNLGADGGGNLYASQFSISVNSQLYTIYYKKIYNAGDPSVNHMIIVKGDGTGIVHSLDEESTDNDFQNIVSESSIDELYYLLFAGNNGYEFTSDDFENIASQFLNVIGTNSSLETYYSNLESGYFQIINKIPQIYLFREDDSSQDFIQPYSMAYNPDNDHFYVSCEQGLFKLSQDGLMTLISDNGFPLVYSGMVFVDGILYASSYFKNYIAIIDPENGNILNEGINGAKTTFPLVYNDNPVTLSSLTYYQGYFYGQQEDNGDIYKFNEQGEMTLVRSDESPTYYKCMTTVTPPKETIVLGTNYYSDSNEERRDSNAVYKFDQNGSSYLGDKILSWLDERIDIEGMVGDFNTDENYIYVYYYSNTYARPIFGKINTSDYTLQNIRLSSIEHNYPNAILYLGNTLENSFSEFGGQFLLAIDNALFFLSTDGEFVLGTLGCNVRALAKYNSEVYYVLNDGNFKFGTYDLTNHGLNEISQLSIEGYDIDDIRGLCYNDAGYFITSVLVRPSGSEENYTYKFAKINATTGEIEIAVSYADDYRSIFKINSNFFLITGEDTQLQTKLSLYVFDKDNPSSYELLKTYRYKVTDGDSDSNELVWNPVDGCLYHPVYRFYDNTENDNGTFVVDKYNPFTEEKTLLTISGFTGETGVNITTDNYISDGGNDMFDGGNVLGTNLAAGIEYTHTRYDTSSHSDGTIENGESWFGSGSTYFTNMYDKIFTMVVNGASINSIYMDGNIGADGSGSVHKEVIHINYDENTSYTVFFKKIYNASDPSVNTMFIFPGTLNTDTETVQYISSNTDIGLHKIYNQNGLPSSFAYLLFGSSNGREISTEEATFIATTFITSAGNDFSDINSMHSNLLSNYQSILDNIPDIFSMMDDTNSPVDFYVGAVRGVGDVISSCYIGNSQILISSDNGMFIGSINTLNNVIEIETYSTETSPLDSMVKIGDYIYGCQSYVNYLIQIDFETGDIVNEGQDQKYTIPITYDGDSYFARALCLYNNNVYGMFFSEDAEKNIFGTVDIETGNISLIHDYQNGDPGYQIQSLTTIGVMPICGDKYFYSVDESGKASIPIRKTRNPLHPYLDFIEVQWHPGHVFNVYGEYYKDDVTNSGWTRIRALYTTEDSNRFYLVADKTTDDYTLRARYVGSSVWNYSLVD